MLELFRPNFPALEICRRLIFQVLVVANFEAIFGSLWPCHRQALLVHWEKVKVISIYVLQSFPNPGNETGDYSESSYVYFEDDMKQKQE